jgi:hypothetical protein
MRLFRVMKQDSNQTNVQIQGSASCSSQCVNKKNYLFSKMFAFGSSLMMETLLRPGRSAILKTKQTRSKRMNWRERICYVNESRCQLMQEIVFGLWEKRSGYADDNQNWGHWYLTLYFPLTGAKISLPSTNSTQNTIQIDILQFIIAFTSMSERSLRNQRKRVHPTPHLLFLQLVFSHFYPSFHIEETNCPWWRWIKYH